MADFVKPEATRASSDSRSNSSFPQNHYEKSESRWQRTYGYLGFKKGYNFPLFIIFAGALLGFTLARLPYLALSSQFATGAAPGEWFWMRSGFRRAGIAIHLGCILPASLLAILQFTPRIRHKFILFHRMNGYVIVFLALVANTGALMITRHAFGGDLSTQTASGTLVIFTTLGLGMAWWNIKRLRIDLHRAWMLRTWFLFGSIITARLIMVIAANVTSLNANAADGSGYKTQYTCGELASMHGLSTDYFHTNYPTCFLADGVLSETRSVLVLATFNGTTPDQIGASLRLNFGMAFWLALTLHLVGVQIYLDCTKGEAERLRLVGEERRRQRLQKGSGMEGGGGGGE